MNKVKNKKVDIKERIALLQDKFNDNGIRFDESRINFMLECAVIDNDIYGVYIDEDDLIDEILSVLETLLNKEIPEYYKDEILSVMSLRFKIIPIQGYSLVSKDWVKPLANWIGDKKCLEIMAGKGTLSYALQSEGKSVIATDGYNWSQFNFNSLWTNVEKLDALEAIERYGRDVDIIIMSWCYMDEVGYKSLLKMREVNPNAVMLYIGEPYGGCTGNDALYDSMIEIDDAEINEINSIYPRWRGIYDRLFLIK